MKKIFAIAVIIIVVVSFLVFETSQVNVNEIDGAVITLDGKEGWTPDKKIIIEFEQALFPYINNFKSREGDNIYINENSLEFVKINLKKYKRQYIGKIIDGRKVLFCNFLLIDEKDDHISDWKIKYILVRDGGPNYFQINYDVENKNFSDFWINGYA